jgi:hypothetical protein
MTTKNTIIGLVAAVVVLGGAAWAYSASQDKAEEAAPAANAGGTGSAKPQGTAQGKVAASTEEDGTHFAIITKVSENPEDTVLTLEHVTFYEGAEATATAKLDVKCEGDIVTCVQTLKQGYYVRKSGSPAWTAPLLKAAKVSISGKANATHEDLALNTAMKSYIPVYKVVIKGGAAVSVTEVSKP